MLRIFGGAALVIAGIAAFIEAHSHRPVLGFAPSPREAALGETGSPSSGLSPDAYDLLTPPDRPLCARYHLAHFDAVERHGIGH
jgi:hypothetical protein